MKRRAFLQGAGGLTVTFVAGCTMPVIPGRPDATAEAASGWIRHVDGRYELFVPRAEMGQNISTSLRQIACEELGVPSGQVTVHWPDTTRMNPVRATVGSESVKDFALPLAQACATLREAVARGDSAVTVAAKPIARSGLRTFSGNTRWVGQAHRNGEGVAIVTGKPIYASDVRLPGMVFGRVLRAPGSLEAASSAAGFDEAAARNVPGFIAVVQDPLLVQGGSTGVGIVGQTPGALDVIEKALAVRWQTDSGYLPANPEQSVGIDNRLQHADPAHSIASDAVDTLAPWDVDLRIDLPAAPHHAIEPRVAVAEMPADNRINLWVGSQDHYYIRDVIAKRLDLDTERVRVQPMRVGGGFGGKTLCTVELEAALLARAVRRPVKVQWLRQQELHQGFHRPPSSHRVRVRLKENRIDQWWHSFASGHIIFTNAGFPSWLQRLADFVGDMGVARGADMPYQATTRRIRFDQVRLPILTGPWRGLGAGPNGFVVESAIDACARHLGEDPLQFRLRHLSDPRLAGVLKRVAALSHWTDGASALPRRPDRSQVRIGRGIACGIYKESSYAAVVAEITVDDEGRVTVAAMYCSHDCGLIVNPDQVRAQCEGNLVWGLGMVLHDRLPVKDGLVTAANFDQSAPPRLADMPEITVDLVAGNQPPGGAGETAIVAAAAAIGNAIVDATGKRVSKLPVVAIAA